MECTGSTLVWQFITEITGRKAKKLHHYAKNASKSGNVYFVTYRDPRDVMCSFARRQLAGYVKKHGMEEALIFAFGSLFEKHKRQNDLMKYRGDSANTSRIHLLKYEHYFCGNEHELLTFILEKMDKSLDGKKKENLIKKYSIEENKKRSAEFSKFGQYDKKTFIHGNHISADGKVGVWKGVFSEKVRELVKKKLGQFLIDFGYEKDIDW
jgi:hypothetical protein